MPSYQKKAKEVNSQVRIVDERRRRPIKDMFLIAAFTHLRTYSHTSKKRRNRAAKRVRYLLPNLLPTYV